MIETAPKQNTVRIDTSPLRLIPIGFYKPTELDLPSIAHQILRLPPPQYDHKNLPTDIESNYEYYLQVQKGLQKHEDNYPNAITYDEYLMYHH